jgi:ABC-type glycerol-3-phosphate transport system substrate-binding protein
MYFLFFFDGQSDDYVPQTSASFYTETVFGSTGLITYDEYLRRHETAVDVNTSMSIDLSTCTDIGMSDAYLTGYQNSDNYYATDERGDLICTVTLPSDGFYNIKVAYNVPLGNSSSAERSILIDGEIPFDGAHILLFSRVWENEIEEYKLQGGNEVRPNQVEQDLLEQDQQIEYISDSRKYEMDAYKFYLENGDDNEVELRLRSIREPLYIHSITLEQEPNVLSYEDYQNSIDSADIYSGEPISFEAERVDGDILQAITKSSPTLYGISDFSSSITNPYHPYYIRFNTMGGYNWRVAGEWIEWTVDVPETGYYYMTLRARQNFNRGLFSSRELTVNGEYPFEEAKAIEFFYDGAFEQYTLGNEDGSFLIPLEQGSNQIRLEVTLGELGPIIENVNQSVTILNDLYRQAVQIMSVTPDRYIDYDLLDKIPNYQETLENESSRLQSIINELLILNDGNGDQIVVLEKMQVLLDTLAEDPEDMKTNLTLFQNNSTALSTWVLSATEQALEIDTFTLHGEADIEAEEASIFEKVYFEIVRFFSTFYVDTGSIEVDNEATEEQTTITVWVPTGRDQAQIIRNLIDENFAVQYPDINVELQLIPQDVILPSTLAGVGPDVVLQVGQNLVDGLSVGSSGLPMNFAMRDASVDLSTFTCDNYVELCDSNIEPFDEVQTWYYPSAFEQVRFQGGVYGIPETQEFLMLFYRKDILAQLELDVPETWDDVEDMIPDLQVKNYEFYMPSTIQMYTSLLYQYGGELYQGEGSDYGIQTGLLEPEAMAAFERWSNFYTSYDFDVEANFANRFRTGEMPIGIQTYTMYNLLSVFAPEIKGMWGFAKLPALNPGEHLSVSQGIYSMMLANNEDPLASWTFIQWWNNEDIQLLYGRSLEGILGAAARYPTANINTVLKLPWPTEHREQIIGQFEDVVGYPEVPGGYMTARQLDYAFRSVINTGQNPLEALYLYTEDIHKELTRKRQEFGLSTND